jgi:hypothetical protein
VPDTKGVTLDGIAYQRSTPSVWSPVELGKPGRIGVGTRASMRA